MGDIDFSTAFGQRALRRLETEHVIWLATTSANGTPQPSPVWFLWEDGSVLVYSQPDTPKVRNIGRNQHVSLNFNSTEHGDNVVVFRGKAVVLGTDSPASANAAYIEKYQAGLDSLGYDAERFAAEYNTLIRVTPTHLRGL